MTLVSKPLPDLVIGAPLVRALLHEQHPDVAHLPLVEIGAGWDNQLYRLGDSLLVRLPRRNVAANLIRHEQQWLPLLAGRLPLPVPAPLRTGRPGCGYPWPWSIVPWFDGHTVAGIAVDGMAMAEDLGRFLRALHEPAPAEAPGNVYRGVPLVKRTRSVLECVKQLGDHIDAVRVLELWDTCVRVSPWSGPALWIHGDLHPGNLVVSESRLIAVVDFGDLTAGDPATDLSIAWAVLPASARSVFRAAARNAVDPIDDDCWARARGWALALGLAYLAHSADDPRLEATGTRLVHDSLCDDPAAVQ